MLKKILIIILTIIFMSPTIKCEALQSQNSFYTTSYGNEENYIEISLDGNDIFLTHSTILKHSNSDSIIINQGSQEMMLTCELEYNNDTNIYYYKKSIDLTDFSNGEVNIKVFSYLEFDYESLNLTILKDENGCRIKNKKSFSQKQNNSLLNLLASGKYQNDFKMLTAMYTNNKDIETLNEIKMTTLNITKDCKNEREKALMIYKWISENIAFDLDMSDNYYSWIKEHPNDKDRLDNPLYAYRNKYAFCYGYSKLTILMMGYADIDCVYIRGWMFPDSQSEDSVNFIPANYYINHAWNAIKIDNSWYFIDTSRASTKGYHEFEYENEKFQDINSLSYMYFCPSLKSISQKQFAIRLGVKNYGTKI